MTKFVLMIVFLSRVVNIEYRFTVVHLVNTFCRKSKTRKDYDLERCTHYVLLIKMEWVAGNFIECLAKIKYRLITVKDVRNI